jgi:hypothetical protein
VKLTWTNIVKDPVYLTEPLIRSGEYRLNLGGAFPAHPCTTDDEGHVKGVVPAHPPGKNPFLKEPAAMTRLPVSLLWSGAESTYPEFKATLPSP